MELLSTFIRFLIAVNASGRFICPNDNSTFYHADVCTDCRVYYLCQSSQLQIFTCPEGQAFNTYTSHCEDASTFHCQETAENPHIQKRSVEEIHTISLLDAKNSFSELVKSVRSLVRQAIKDVAPTVYDNLQSYYLPTIQAIRDDILPIVREKYLPHIQKTFSYTRRLTSRLIEKAYKSYELSNSTHINIVSFSDIARDVSNDIEPVLRLGRYMSNILFQNRRSKRSVDVEQESEVTRQKRQIPELFSGLMSIFAGISDTILGTQNTLTSKVILPILYDMAGNPETVFDIRRLVWSIKAAIAPLISDSLSLQGVNSAEGTIIRIPQASIDAFKDRLITETKPIIRKIAERHLRMILLTASDNVPLIIETIHRLSDAYHVRDGALGDSILDFITKHGSLLRTSTSTHMNSYTLAEIKKDLWPIKVNLVKMIFDYYTRTSNSWFLNIFGKGFSTTESHISHTNAPIIESSISYASIPTTDSSISNAKSTQILYKRPIGPVYRKSVGIIKKFDLTKNYSRV